jgi:hypothetical protein
LTVLAKLVVFPFELHDIRRLRVLGRDLSRHVGLCRAMCGRDGTTHSLDWFLGLLPER